MSTEPSTLFAPTQLWYLNRDDLKFFLHEVPLSSSDLDTLVSHLLNQGWDRQNRLQLAACRRIFSLYHIVGDQQDAAIDAVQTAWKSSLDPKYTSTIDLRITSSTPIVVDI